MFAAVSAPPGFVSYVDRRLGQLEVATLRLTGDDAQAERMAREMLTLVALRWQGLSRSDTRQGMKDGFSADMYLSRLYRHEADELSYPQTALKFDGLTVGPRRRAGRATLRTADEAELIWEAARRIIRRRLILGAAAVGVVGIVALCQRGGGSTAGIEADIEIEDRSSALPAGAERAPEEISGRRDIIGVPPVMTIPPRDEAPLLSANPVKHALVLAASSRADASPIYVLGDDGRWRTVDSAPTLSPLWLQACALSPDGKWAAFGTDTGVTVTDLTTGVPRQYSFAPANTTRPVWLSPRHLVAAVNAMVDPVTGVAHAVPAGPEDLVSPRTPTDLSKDPLHRLVELLSFGSPSTAPARVRRWIPNPAAGPQQAVLPLNGPLTELIGPWRGPGFGYGDETGRVARVFTPHMLPSTIGTSAGVAVVLPRTGRVERVLLIDTNKHGNVRLLGWSGQRHVVMALSQVRRSRIVTWDIEAGGLRLTADVNSDGVISLPDLSWVA